MASEPHRDNSSSFDDMTPEKALEIIGLIPLVSQSLFSRTKHHDRLLISEDGGVKIFLSRKNFPSKSFNLLNYMGELYERFYDSWNVEQKQHAIHTLKKYQELISRNPKRCQIIFPDSGPS